ncbi:MAG: AzlD domain-containing protein [Anaerolineales bacterium]
MAALWLTILTAGLLTFLTRLSFIALFGRWQPPDWLRHALRFVPPAVLSAIIFPEVLMRDGALAVQADNFRLVAALVAALVAWRTRNVFLTIGSGMAVLYLLQWLR